MSYHPFIIGISVCLRFVFHTFENPTPALLMIYWFWELPGCVFPTTSYLNLYPKMSSIESG